MFKKLAITGATALLAALTVTPTATAAAPYALQVKERPSKIHGNGTVTIKFWLRCPVGDNAFEYSVGVRQGASFGGVSGGPSAGLLPCDGTRHLQAVHVPATEGAWTRGYADVSVNVQVYDGQSDLSLDDTGRTWLKR